MNQNTYYRKMWLFGYCPLSFVLDLVIVYLADTYGKIEKFFLFNFHGNTFGFLNLTSPFLYFIGVLHLETKMIKNTLYIQASFDYFWLAVSY